MILIQIPLVWALTTIFLSLVSRMNILILQVNFPSKYGKSGTLQNVFSIVVQEKQRSKSNSPKLVRLESPKIHLQI
jgi:hypothetical protein